MLLISRIFAVLVVLMGIAYLLLPVILDKIVLFAKSGKNFFLIAIIRAVFGVVLLFAAAHSRVPWFVTSLGIVMLSSGFVPFILGIEKSRALVDWFDTKPLIVKRIMSGILIIVGGVLLYCL